MNSEEEIKIKNIISKCIDEIVNKIRNTKDYDISKNKEHKITKIIKEKIGRDKQTKECVNVNIKQSIYIPHDEYYRTLVFSLEKVWAEKNKHKLEPIFENFNLSPEKYIYHSLIKKENINKCAFEIKVEFNLKRIQYINDNNEMVDFSYDIDEDIYDEYEEDSENVDEETKEDIEKFKKFCEFITEKIEKCGSFTVMTLTNWNSEEFQKNNNYEGGHRNVILIENTENEIYFNHYEPHGSETDYLYEEREDLFEKLLVFMLKLTMRKNMKIFYLKTELDILKVELNKNKKLLNKLEEKNLDEKAIKKQKKLEENKKNLETKLQEINIELKYLENENKMKKITIEPFSSSICIGLQTFLKDHDIGYCSLFSFFWLYSVLKCFIYMENNYNDVPPMKTWVKYFEYILIEKFKNNQEKLYDLVIAFAYKLFSEYYSSNLITETDRIFINIIQNGSINNLFKKYEEEIKNKKIKLYIEKKPEKVDEEKCNKNIQRDVKKRDVKGSKKSIETDIIIDDFQEDEGIEIDNANFEENNENEIEEGPLPPEYEDFDEDDKYENVNNLSEEEKRKLLEEVYGEDIFNVEREYNEHNIEDIEPRDYGYEDINEDMEVEFVDETNQNEY